MPVREEVHQWKNDSFSCSHKNEGAPQGFQTHDDAATSVVHVELNMRGGYFADQATQMTRMTLNQTHLQFLCMDFIDAVDSQARHGYLDKRASEATECLDLFPLPQW